MNSLRKEIDAIEPSSGCSLHEPQAARLSLNMLLILLMLLWASSHSGASNAGAREQAKRIHDRIAGVPPTAQTLDAMTQEIEEGKLEEAAYRAIEDSNFYNVTLKNFAAPWTNEDQTLFVPLNDYTATVIGIVRDDIDFRQLLYGDILYVGAPDPGIPAYATNNNDHYEALENNGVDLKSNLIATSQSATTGINPAATAGIMTSRAAAQAFFIDGTNRAMLRFTLMNHLCRDLEQVKDTTRSPDRVRQDITRSPGGDSRIFLNSCVGCHSGLDPLAQAYAYYDYSYDSDTDPDAQNGRLTYNDAGDSDPVTGTRVVAKYHINENNFKYGFRTPDDKWDNYWRSGPNLLLGWDQSLLGAGSGAKSMGQELAHSDAFAQCQVEKVFKAVCLREPLRSEDRLQVDVMVNSFEQSNYNMKQAFVDAAIFCSGE